MLSFFTFVVSLAALRHVNANAVQVYYTTHFAGANYTKFIDPTPLAGNVTYLDIGAFHINETHTNGTVLFLNDDPWYDPRHQPVWDAAAKMRSESVKVIGMLGGWEDRPVGTYGWLSGDNFAGNYPALVEMINSTGLQGLDLDVEMSMPLADMANLVNHLKADFGPDFIIGTAPQAQALKGESNLSGFMYKDLDDLVGENITFYTAQCYCGGGPPSFDLYKSFIDNGFKPEKVILGTLTNASHGCDGDVYTDVSTEIVPKILEAYPNFAGVGGWEYFESMPAGEQKPQVWAETVSKSLKTSQ